MIRIENFCVDCTSIGLHCLGESCPNMHVEVHYCDKCGIQLDEIYECDGEELCADCLLDKFRKE